MKKIISFFTLLVIVTSISSFSGDIFEPKQVPVKFYIDYGNTIEALNVAGHYSVFKKEISSGMFKKEKSFGKDTLDAVLVTFHEFTSSENALCWMQDHRLRPATIKEVQFFGIKTGANKEYGIVALGSKVIFSAGLSHIPLLQSHGKKLSIGLYPFDGFWNPYYGFLCIKVKS